MAATVYCVPKYFIFFLFLADICGHDSNYLIIAVIIIIQSCCWCSVAICFTYHSQTRILLSSDVVTNLLF